MPLALRVALGVAVVAALAAVVLHGIGAGWFGRGETAGEVTNARVPAVEIARRAAAQRAAALAAGAEAPKQILFGDFHVHTTFSFDAFLMNLPIVGGVGAHPPADACDFARYCSGLDFWSINDHAENLSERLWNETVDSVRQCNAVAGDSRSPDLVTYLGWEWSQIGRTPDTHYGHKNVVLRDTEPGTIPARPIAAASGRQATYALPTGAATAVALLNGQRGRDFAYLLAEMSKAVECPAGVPVRELPTSCAEVAPDPETLFAKLSDWAFPSVVIPHGTTWGMYTPAGSSWVEQLPGNDDSLQRLVEIYSGHGNSEEYRDWRATLIHPDGSVSCPEPSVDYLPSCWRSGELVRARCLELGEPEDECERRAVRARQRYVDTGHGGWRTIPGHTADAWLDSGQCRDCFQPAFNYRPASSVQYMLALRDFGDPSNPRRFDLGFIGSSDNHGARPGTGYKEFWRGGMTEAPGRDPENPPPSIVLADPGEPAAESEPFDPEGAGILGLFENERGSAFFVTGGLVAAHSAGRDRDAIWHAIDRREVYATSGPRILLWFDLLENGAAGAPMGSSATRSEAPRFRVRAVGSFEQRPGCPEHSLASLSAERLDRLCRGECYHPSDRRRTITRIEVVRIRPQNHADEPVAPLIEDPWLRFECDPDPAGCEVEFEDPSFARAGRDALYYVRAIEEPSLAIHANPQRCRYDATGRCVEVKPCTVLTDRDDDCLDPTEQRAWSSPIFVEYHPLDAPAGRRP